jgi:hypothetical protein
MCRRIHFICEIKFVWWLCRVTFANEQDASEKKSETIPVTGRGGPQNCETSRLPHFPDNRLTDGGEVVRLTRRPPFTARKIPHTHFYRRLSGPQGQSAAGGIRSIEKSSDLIGI